MGCYENNALEHEFTVFSAHSSVEEMSPFECQKGCSVMGFELASIEKNNLCFCKNGLDLKMEKIPDENCEHNVCRGDSNYYCGSESSILVYSTKIFVKVN